MKLFTIGFTEQTAEEFFSRIKAAGVSRVLDVRLHNNSQLAGFAKKGDLPFFLRELCGVDYVHALALAPTEKLFDAYKKKKGPWPAFEKGFRKLLVERKVDKLFSKASIDGSCLLCGELKPDHCHRKVIAEYMAQKWKGLHIEHL